MKNSTPQDHFSCPFLTLKDTAMFLRVSPMTVYRMMKEKKIPAFRTSGNKGYFRFRREDVDKLLSGEKV